MGAEQDDIVVFRSVGVREAAPYGDVGAVLHYVLVDGVPARDLKPDFGSGMDWAESLVARYGGIPRGDMASSDGPVPLCDGRSVRFWHVASSTHGSLVLAEVEGGPTGLLARDAESFRERARKRAARIETEAVELQVRVAQAAEEDREDDAIWGGATLQDRIQAALAGAGRELACVPELQEVSDPGGSVSGYFVSPWMPESEEWPSVRGILMLPVLQIDLEKAPRRMRSLLGERGFLQFFMAPTAQSYEHGIDSQDHLLIRILDPGRSAGEFRPLPSEVLSEMADEGHLARGIASWKEEVDVDGDGIREAFSRIEAEMSLRFDIADRLEEDEFRYGKKVSSLSGISGDKALGFPNFCQGDHTPREPGGLPWIHVFQFDFEDLPARGLNAGDGYGHIYMAPGEPARMVYLWQCG